MEEAPSFVDQVEECVLEWSVKERDMHVVWPSARVLLEVRVFLVFGLLGGALHLLVDGVFVKRSVLKSPGFVRCCRLDSEQQLVLSNVSDDVFCFGLDASLSKDVVEVCDNHECGKILRNIDHVV